MSDDASKQGPTVPISVDSLFTDPRLIERRMRHLVEQQFVARQLLPPPVLTRRQRIARGLRARRDAAREAVALRIAPWLVSE